MAYLDYAGLQRYHGKIEDNFAKIDGAYEGMTVGNAEELVTGLEEEESVPFIFRTSGGHLEIGSREDLTVVGGSLAWNQQVSDISDVGANSWQPYNSFGAVSYADGELTYTINSIANTNYGNTIKSPTFTRILNHKYLVLYDIYVPHNGTANAAYFSGAILTPVQAGWNTIGTIGNSASTDSATNLFGISKADDAGYVAGESYKIKNPIIVDLTQLFGSTIADYIYQLEQNTAGAGVAFFKKLFPKDYYPYNAGELLSVNASAFKTVGFNQFNKSEAVDGKYINNSTGEEAASSASAHTGYIRVVPNTNYYTNAAGVGYFSTVNKFDINKNFIGYVSGSTAGVFNTGDAHYIIVNTVKAQTSIDDLIVYLHWDNTRDGEYEPYVEHSYALDSDLTLRGIPKLDADNNLYYDGDTYEADGSVKRKYGIVDLGTLTWARWGEYAGMFTAELDNLKQPSTTSERRTGILCSKYSITENISLNENWTDKSVGRYLSKIVVKDTSYSDLASFQTAMSGVYLVYELATPTTETADAYQKPQIVDNWGTEEFTVTEQSGVAVPVGHNTIYPISLRDKLEAMPNLPSEDGDYILRMRSGEPAYIALANEFPAPPTTDGTYTLKATVSSGAATLTWEEVNA